VLAVLGLTRRPDNRGAIYELDLDGTVLRTIASGLPPISGITFGLHPLASVSVPEPTTAAAAIAALALVGAQRRRAR
jgi:hypothetical protein